MSYITVLCFDILAGFVREDHPFFVQNLDSFLSLYSKLSKSLTVGVFSPADV